MIKKFQIIHNSNIVNRREYLFTKHYNISNTKFIKRQTDNIVHILIKIIISLFSNMH